MRPIDRGLAPRSYPQYKNAIKDLTAQLGKYCSYCERLIDEARELVIEVAKSRGFFSVWMTVFENYPEVKKELIQLFPGTAICCFDSDGKPVNRTGAII
jgi:hypothetical protein